MKTRFAPARSWAAFVFVYALLPACGSEPARRIPPDAARGAGGAGGSRAADAAGPASPADAPAAAADAPARPTPDGPAATPDVARPSDAAPDAPRPVDARADGAVEAPRDQAVASPDQARPAIDAPADLPPPPPDTAPDLPPPPPDAAPDLPPPSPDTEPDVPPPALDVAPDVAPDLEPDAAPDAAADAAPDLAPDVAPDVVPPDRVHGRVVDQFGRGIANHKVVVDGKLVLTAQDGTFTVSGVAATYDVKIARPDGLTGYLLVGLTRRDLLLPLSIQAPSGGKSASISGTVSGGGSYPLGAQDALRLWFMSPSYQAAVLLTAGAAAGGAYGPLNVTWYDTVTLPGTLRALRFTRTSSGAPDAYTGYSELPLTLADGNTLSSISLTLGAVTSSLVSGSVSVPAAYALANRRGILRFADAQAHVIFTDTSTASTAFSYRMPSGIPGQTMEIDASASDTVAQSTAFGVLRNVAAGATNLSLGLMEPPALVSPAAGAAGIGPGSAFQWTARAGTISQAIFYSDDTSRPLVIVWTNATTAVMPDLAVVGVTLPSNAAYKWAVRHWSQATSLDDTYALDVKPPLSSYLYHTDSASRAMTTRP